MYKIHKLFPYYYQEVLEMAQKKYRPGMNCEKTGKYTCYDKDGNEMYGDVDVEKGRRFPPSQEEGCYYEEQEYLFGSVELIQWYKKKNSHSLYEIVGIFLCLLLLRMKGCFCIGLFCGRILFRHIHQTVDCPSVSDTQLQHLNDFLLALFQLHQAIFILQQLFRHG